MLQLREEFFCGAARLRIDVYGSKPIKHVLDEMTYLNYRLANVQIESEVVSSSPGIIWHQDADQKSIRYDKNRLTLEGEWHQGELQKIIVSMLALQMEYAGLHPFHSSAIRYRDCTIMFMGGEDNHGKTMSQIEGSQRGGLIVSTETTVTNEEGWVVMGSKNVFLRMRAKGTERIDKPDQDQGIAKLFNQIPEFIIHEESHDIDLVILPDIDGHYDTIVGELAPFEREYQTYHSLMNYLGLQQILAPGLPMPIIDTDKQRLKRAAFCHRFVHRPFYIIRAKNPQIVLDNVERLLDQLS